MICLSTCFARCGLRQYEIKCAGFLTENMFWKIRLEFENLTWVKNLILMGFEPMSSRPMEALAFRANGVNHSAIEPLGISPHRTYKSLKSNLFLKPQVEVVSTVTAHMTVSTHTLSDVTHPELVWQTCTLNNSHCIVLWPVSALVLPAVGYDYMKLNGQVPYWKCFWKIRLEFENLTWVKNLILTGFKPMTSRPMAGKQVLRQVIILWSVSY